MRYYDPQAGRFVSRDPIGMWGDPGQRGNAQNYCGNNPINQVDPLGDSPWSLAAKKAATAAAKKALRRIIKKKIKKKLGKAATKKGAGKRLLERAEELLDALDSEWWELGIEFIPILGDAYGCASFKVKYDRLKRKIRTIERMADKMADAEKVRKARRKLKKANKTGRGFSKKDLLAMAAMWRTVTEMDEAALAAYLVANGLMSAKEIRNLVKFKQNVVVGTARDEVFKDMIQKGRAAGGLSRNIHVTPRGAKGPDVFWSGRKGKKVRWKPTDQWIDVTTQGGIDDHLIKYGPNGMVWRW